MAPRLMAALGSQRERYQSAAEIHRCSGIAPVVASSGKQHWVHWRWACPKFLRLTFQRVGTPFDCVLGLGSRVLRPAARKREPAEYGDPLARLQMDSHPFPLLGAFQAVRRGRLSSSIGGASAESTAHRCSCRPPVEKRRWLQQNRASRGLTEKLRCLSSYQTLHCTAAFQIRKAKTIRSGKQ